MALLTARSYGAGPSRDCSAPESPRLRRRLTARSVTTGALPRLTGKRPNVAVVTTEGAGAGRRRAWGSRRGAALRAADDPRRSLQARPARPRWYPPEAGAGDPTRRARPPRADRPPIRPALGRGATAECRRLLANVRLGAATPYDQRSRPRAPT